MPNIQSNNLNRIFYYIQNIVFKLYRILYYILNYIEYSIQIIWLDIWRTYNEIFLVSIGLKFYLYFAMCLRELKIPYCFMPELNKFPIVCKKF